MPVSCPVTGFVHALAANIIPSIVEMLLIGYVKNYVLKQSPKKITKNISVEKTYFIRKVGSEYKEANVGLFPTFHHPLESMLVSLAMTQHLRLKLR